LTTPPNISKIFPVNQGKNDGFLKSDLPPGESDIKNLFDLSLPRFPVKQVQKFLFINSDLKENAKPEDILFRLRLSVQIT